MTTISLALPVKDEEAGLGVLMNEFKESKLSGYEALRFIFVIDDRTNDRSREVSKKFGGVVIDQSKPHGKGLAIRLAISHWSENPTDFFVMMDADGSYRWDDVYKVIKELESGAEAVVGVRLRGIFSRLEGMSLLHHLGNHALAYIASLRNRKKIHDLCSGLWGFNIKSMEKITPSSTGFELEAELHGVTRNQKIEVTQIPIDWRVRVGGESKLNSFADGFKILKKTIFS